MKIGFDVDGVLADFNAAFIDRIIRVTNRDLFPRRPFDIPCWSYPAHYGYTPEEEHSVWTSIKADKSFWRTLSAYPDAGDVLRILHLARTMGHDVYFVTARPGVNAKLQTELWLSNLGMENPTVLISPHKLNCARALELDVYIDDKVENCFSVADHCKTYLVHRPWNSPETESWRAARGMSDVTVIRVDSASEMIADVAREWR